MSAFHVQLKIRELLIAHPEGITTGQLAKATDLHRDTVNHHLTTMNATSLQRGLYTLAPDPDDMKFAKAVIDRLLDTP